MGVAGLQMLAVLVILKSSCGGMSPLVDDFLNDLINNGNQPLAGTLPLLDG